MKIQIILGSTRQNRMGDKVAKWVLEQAKQKKDAEFELIDLREYPLPFFDEPMPPMMAGGKYVNPAGRKWADKVGEADGYIFVMPEYNHGYSAVLKNAIDYVYKEWEQKPVGFIGYSGAPTGATHSIEQLIQVCVQLKMVPASTRVEIPNVFDKINEKGEFKGDEFIEHTGKFLDNVIWWTTLLKTAREKK